MGNTIQTRMATNKNINNTNGNE